MAMSLNRAQIIGNLTRDPEVRQIPGGQIVATFGVATNFTWVDQTGQKQEKPEFHNIVAWRKLAEICGQYLKKGSKDFIEGRIQTRTWEAEDGTKKYRTEIIAENMIMLDRKMDNISSPDAEIPQAQAPHAGLNNQNNVNTEEALPSQESKVSNETGDTPNTQNNEEVKVEDLPF
jgi:single-strand DNA-binding protein